MNYEDKIEFLIKAGCGEQDHSDLTLLDHLEAVSYRIFLGGHPQHLIDAGLFHSIYGTTVFKPSMVNFGERDLIKEMIGDKAEELVYWFCKCKPPRFRNIMKLPDGQFQRDLLILNTANQDDVNASTRNLKDFYNV